MQSAVSDRKECTPRTHPAIPRITLADRSLAHRRGEHGVTRVPDKRVELRTRVVADRTRVDEDDDIAGSLLHEREHGIEHVRLDRGIRRGRRAREARAQARGGDVFVDEIGREREVYGARLGEGASVHECNRAGEHVRG